MAQTRIPCLLMRGGTSKAACFLDSDLPEQCELLGCGLVRTSRVLFDGVVCIAQSLWEGR